jgi:hypothetical protein
MQALAAYLIFLLAFITLGLTIIVTGVVSIALYEGASWMWSRLSSPSVGEQRIGSVLNRVAKQNIQRATDVV